MKREKSAMIKKFVKNNLDFIVPLVIIAIVLLVAGRFAWHWLQWDVKEIEAEFVDSEEVHAFTYEGKTYYEIDCWTASDSFYKGLDKERLGRVKGSGVVLYAIKDDTDKEIIMGQNPINEVFVFAYRYNHFPVDGEVTSTYVNLGIPGVHGEGSSHLSIKKEDFVDDDLSLFQKIWDKKYENAPISFVHPFSMENEVVIGCDMCFEECPVPGTYLYAAYQDGQWYFIKTEWRQEGYTSQDYYHGYPVNDPEILEFLNAYAEGYITSE